MSEANEYAGAVDRGLEGVVACSTAISTIAGTTLLYRGYTIEDLAAHATFEEVAHLLWFGRLPSADEFARFQRQLDDAMALPAESFGPKTVTLLRAANAAPSCRVSATSCAAIAGMPIAST